MYNGASDNSRNLVVSWDNNISAVKYPPVGFPSWWFVFANARPAYDFYEDLVMCPTLP